MIYSLEGKIILIQDNFLVIQCSGVGYKCLCSTTTQSFFSDKINKISSIYTYMNVRQDALDLFGFFNINELNSFKLLISVSGVGPKVALGILSCFSSEKIAEIIANADSKSLTSAPGIGAKTAKRIILELKDKFAELTDINLIKDNQNDMKSKNKNEAINVLISLGYSKSEANLYVSNLSSSLSVEQMIQSVLKNIGRGG